MISNFDMNLIINLKMKITDDTHRLEVKQIDRWL